MAAQARRHKTAVLLLWSCPPLLVLAKYELLDRLLFVCVCLELYEHSQAKLRMAAQAVMCLAGQT